MSSSTQSSRTWPRPSAASVRVWRFPFLRRLFRAWAVQAASASFWKIGRARTISSSSPPTWVKFLGALAKRPEIAIAIPTYFPAVPQLFAEVDREKVAQQQVSQSDVYTTMQTFMGGYLVNYFNRFGRQWQTYVEAEGEYRTNPDNIGRFYVTSANGNRVPLSSLVKVSRDHRTRIHHSLQ